jgi:hypothetical protein
MATVQNSLQRGRNCRGCESDHDNNSTIDRFLPRRYVRFCENNNSLPRGKLHGPGSKQACHLIIDLLSRSLLVLK